MTKEKISSEKQQKDLQFAWERWFDFLEQLEPLFSKKKPDEYGKALIEKYTNQGLELSS